MTTFWVVPHTHWDREWYEPHDVFRARLVRMIDGLLDLLEAEPDYRFTLDGQSAAFEDYLEIRPEERRRVERAVERGQLEIGPFLILLDEFTCDGETIVRNLEQGIASARRVGPEMRVGYLPDMFGHTAQMPQILRGFGIDDACMWRGIPGSVDKHAFMWEALNGDEVRVEYLWDGYGNALKLFDPLEKMPQLVAGYAAEHASWFMGEDIAGWFGSDHTAPRPDLADIVRAYNDGGHELTMRIATVGELISSRGHSDGALSALPRIVGEMRSSARGNILAGVLSIRTNIKAAMARAERALTTAERLDVLLGGPSRMAFFERGWRLVIESTAHDSVTGCGHDATAEQVENRLDVAHHTAVGALDITLPGLAALAPAGGVAVFNQTGWPRRVQAELVTEEQSLPETVQVLEDLPAVIGDESIRTEDLPKVLRRIHGQELFGKLIRGWTWEGDELTFEVAPEAAGDFDLSVFAEALDERVREHHADKVWRVRTVVPPSKRVLVAGEVGGMSAIGLTTDGSTVKSPVRVEQMVLDNGLVRVEVREDGLVDATDLITGNAVVGALGLVDDGDCGDSYNYGKVSDDPVVEPSRVDVEVLERGPLRGRILVRRTLRLPEGLQPDDRSRRSGALVDLHVETLLELREGESFLRVVVSTTNNVKDHRLRVLVPTMKGAVATSASAGQYGVTERGRTAEGGWGEYPLPTFPGYRFVHAGGVGVLLDKLVEYEVVDREPNDALALTVLRSVGLMSVNLHPLRDEPAGSEVPTPGAQYLGEHVELRFGLDLRSPEWSDSEIMRRSEAFRFEPVVVAGTGSEVGALSAGVEARGQVVLESLRRLEGVVEARLVNYSRSDQPMHLAAEGSWDRCDMTGGVIEPDIDVRDHVVPAGSIVTIRRSDGDLG